MLITDKQIKEGDIISLKLTTGEEVIGRLVTPFGVDLSATLAKPMAFMMGPQGLGLVPFVFSANTDDNITISGAFIIAKAKTAEQVAKQYMQQTSNLLIP